MTADHTTRKGDIEEHREKLLAALLSVGANPSPRAFARPYPILVPVHSPQSPEEPYL